MLKRIIIIFAFLISHTFLFSQTTNLSGKIGETDDSKGVKNAVVALLDPFDSTFAKFTRTDESGSYDLTGVPEGNYIFMVMHPFYADYVEDIKLEGVGQKKPLINLIQKSKLLEEVILKSGSPMRIKGDTTIYTADSFNVSANANVEELLKKLPGIQVDKDGKIKAMGEAVQKVLVDGEEFFGDDPGMAVKNLRADAVKEVQVFDKKSDQAEFTGIDDGNTQKTINLKLKENKKNGYFGKIGVSGGLSDTINNRFNNNLMFSTFKGKRKLSAFLLNGNTGQDGLSWEDAEKFGANDQNFSTDDGVVFVYRNSQDDEPYINTSNGFITNINGGIQYSNKWNDKTNLNLSPKYNSQDYYNTMDYFNQTTVGDSMLFENAASATKVKRYNIKTSGILDIKIDSSNTLKITVKGNFYNSESEENRNSISKGDFGTIKNTSNRLLNANSEKQSFGSTFLFNHKFKKARRTLSINGNWNILKSDGENYLKSQNQGYVDGLPSFLIDLNQYKDNLSSSTNFTSKVIYTEPLSKNYSIEIAHEVSLNKGSNDQVTYTYSPVSEKYDIVVDSLTNDFSQSIITNKPSVKINYSTKKLKYNFGSGFGFTHFNLTDNTINKDYIRDFTNFYPTASLTYSYKTSASFRINYNGYTTQPSINQLQPLRNNDDYYNQYIGNPDLKTSFTNSLNISHHSYDFLKDRWMYQALNVSLVNNSITNNKTINLDSGKTIIQPINTDGNLSINFWGGTGFKLKKSKIRIDVNPNLGYNRFADYINSIKSYSNNLSAGIRAGISKAVDKKYDITLANSYNYNSNKLSQQPNALHYQTNNLSLDATVYYKKVWSVITDYNFYSREKTPQFNTNLNSHIWNAKLQRTFKKDEFTAYFKVMDILKQDIGIDRSFYGNSFTETRNDRLQRYWLVGFTWNFKNK